MRPHKIAAAAVSSRGTLELALVYGDGHTYHIVIESEQDLTEAGRAEFYDYSVRWAGPYVGRLPDSVQPVRVLPGHYVEGERSDGESKMLLVRLWPEDAHMSLYTGHGRVLLDGVELPLTAPFRLFRGRTLLAVLATPFTVSFDLLTSPVQAIYIVYYYSEGGH